MHKVILVDDHYIVRQGLEFLLSTVDDLSVDRKSVVQGKSVDLGGRRIIKKKKRYKSGVVLGGCNKVSVISLLR